jgi:chromosomal replication initiator protein
MRPDDHDAPTRDDGDAPLPGMAAASQPWDGLLEGPETALAVAAAHAVARGGREGLCPLVLHGPSGVGKSRLLAGLVGEFLLRHPGAAVAMLAADELAAACGAAADRADGSGWAELRARLRTVDLLAIDDLPGLARAPLALVELGHTLDDLDAAGAAVVATARDGPGQWEGFPPRLASRLGAGLAVRIDPPGPATRRRYLLDRARARGLTVAADAVDACAAAADSYRALDGLLARLALESRSARRPLDGRLAAEALAEPGAAAAPVRVADVARAVASRFKVPLRELRGPSRRAAVAQPRHLAIYLARRHAGLSIAALGAYFGGRDTKTIRHAIAAAAARLAADPAQAALAESLAAGWARPAPPGDEEP